MRFFSTILFTLALAFGPVRAFAQSNTAAAEALFQEGRTLFQKGQFAAACPKLAESNRLDPATGTLLTLALCHEGEGKLASAWAEFNDVEGRSQREGRDDRVKIAREHTNALKPRLSTLAVDVPPEVAATAGFELRVDGVALGSGSFGVAVPVDGGEHGLDASAPGKAAWHSTVTVKPESDASRVSVPPLADAATAAPAAVVTPAPAAPPPEEPSESSGSGMRTAGLVTAGVGVVALGVGTYLGFAAKSDYDDAKKQCTGTVCPHDAFQASEDARSRGTVATVVFVVGGAALATGAVLYFIAPSGKEDVPKAARLRIDRVGVGPGRVVLGGSF